MRIKKLLAIAFLFLFVGSITAQETVVKKETIKKEVIKKEKKSVFSLDGEYRTRFESTPGIDMSGAGNGRAILVAENSPGSMSLAQRARITAHYNNNKFETKFSIQDVRMFGENMLAGKMFKSNYGDGLAVHEAWAMYKFINKEGHVLGLKIGRQELALDARVLWNKNWTHHAAAYDGVKLQCRNKDLGLNWDLGFAMNSMQYPGTASPFRTLGFFKATKSFGKMIKVSLIDMYEGLEAGSVLNEEGKLDSTSYKNTLGIRPVVKVAGVTFDAGIYMQTGKYYNSAKDESKNNAMLYTANLAYTIAKKYKVGAGYDNYSGKAWDYNDATVNPVYGAPYGGAHKYFGNTDVHTKLFGKGYGITDINFKASAKLLKTTSVSFQFHKIDFANNATNDGGTTTFKDVGNNIDFVLTHKFDKKVFVNLGYSLFMPSDNYVDMQPWGTVSDAKTHNFIWAMFTFKPNFLKVTK